MLWLPVTAWALGVAVEVATWKLPVVARELPPKAGIASQVPNKSTRSFLVPPQSAAAAHLDAHNLNRLFLTLAAQATLPSRGGPGNAVEASQSRLRPLA